MRTCSSTIGGRSSPSGRTHSSALRSSRTSTARLPQPALASARSTISAALAPPSFAAGHSDGWSGASTGWPRRSAKVFFQNPDDLKLFVDGGLVREEQAQLIPGSGIDLEHFRPSGTTRNGDDRFRFLFVGRLLRDKGLVEYAEAARLLRPGWPRVEFAILGFAGSDNRSAVPIAEVERWHAEGIVTYLGESEDVRPFIAEADCIVLPSYREGLPRSLLEASAMATPMVASDVAGCREIVRDGDTGFLCAAQSAESLAEAMQAMLRLAPEERSAMGARARVKVEREFDQALVARAYLQALQ
jgi:glycosyltransferase involved in cell wall biosynthesis